MWSTQPVPTLPSTASSSEGMRPLTDDSGVPQGIPGTQGMVISSMTPVKLRMHEEVQQLRTQLEMQRVQAQQHTDTVRQNVNLQAQQAMAQQRDSFEQTAREFEREARDVAHAEVAQQAARLQGQFRGALTDSSCCTLPLGLPGLAQRPNQNVLRKVPNSFNMRFRINFPKVP
jgi:hypothetical protein